MGATSIDRRAGRRAGCRRHHTSCQGTRLPARRHSANLVTAFLLMAIFTQAQKVFVSGLAPRVPTRLQLARPRRLPGAKEASDGSRRPEITVALAAIPLPGFSPSALLATLGPLGFFVAGGLCSSFSHVIATPIDVIKTSQQATEEREGRCPGMLQMAMQLVKKYGPQKLLSGVGATFTGYFLHGAFKYGLFEVWKAIFRIHLINSMVGHICLLCLCALLAEMLATVVLCPAEAARIMLVADPSFMEPTRQAYERFCKQQKRGMHGIHQNLGCPSSCSEPAQHLTLRLF